jgi:hypothetical protein
MLQLGLTCYNYKSIDSLSLAVSGSASVWQCQQAARCARNCLLLLLLLPLLQVVLDAASVRCGVVLLEPKSLRLIGGRVDALAEAWETQKK